MGGNLRYVRNAYISYIVCMYVTAPSTVHSMYPQHVGPLQLLSGEECTNDVMHAYLDQKVMPLTSS